MCISSGREKKFWIFTNLGVWVFSEDCYLLALLTTFSVGLEHGATESIFKNRHQHSSVDDHEIRILGLVLHYTRLGTTDSHHCHSLYVRSSSTEAAFDK